MKEKNYTFPKNNIFEFFITNSISTNQNIPTNSDQESGSDQDEEGDQEDEESGSDQDEESDQEDDDEEDKTLISIPNPTISMNNRLDLKEKTNNKQIYDYTIKEFYYNFINSTLEITKSIKETMSNSSDMKTKSSLMDVLSNKKNLINVGIMLILISILLIPVILS